MEKSRENLTFKYIIMITSCSPLAPSNTVPSGFSFVFLLTPFQYEKDLTSPLGQVDKVLC